MHTHTLARAGFLPVSVEPSGFLPPSRPKAAVVVVVVVGGCVCWMLLAARVLSNCSLPPPSLLLLLPPLSCLSGRRLMRSLKTSAERGRWGGGGKRGGRKGFR